jgi:hypothetical protein
VNLRYVAALSLQRKIFQTKALEKIGTHILCIIFFFLPKIVPFFEIMWKNMVKVTEATAHAF